MAAPGFSTVSMIDGRSRSSCLLNESIDPSSSSLGGSRFQYFIEADEKKDDLTLVLLRSMNILYLCPRWVGLLA